MNLIEVHNAHSKIIPQSMIVQDIVEEILSYAPAGAVFAKMHNPGWSGRIKLMNRKNEFPTGLIPHLVTELKRRKIEYKFKDLRTKPTKKYEFKVDGFPPRPYQAACAEMSDERTRGVFVMGTGAGKSYTAALITQRRGLDTLIITPDTGLRTQLSEDFKKWFGKSAIGTKITEDKPIIITNIQSLAKADPKLFLRFSCLMVDEFHHCFSGETKINTQRNLRTIKDIYETFHSGKKLRVKSWDGTKWEDKPVTNAFKYKSNDLLKVKIQDEDGKIKELLVTRKHKFLTDEGKMEIGSMKVGDQVVLGYITHAEAMRKRSNNEDYKKHLSERATRNNPMRSEEVRLKQAHKLKEKIKNGEYIPYGRGRLGNGGELSETQKRLLEILPNSIAELSVAPRDGEKPYHYKIDVALLDKGIAIEVDGSSHKNRIEQDKRKDERLGRLGWKVIRIPENCSKGTLFRLKKLTEIMTFTT